MINWIPLEKQQQLSEITDESFIHPVVLYKHSTRCGVSSYVLNRLSEEFELTKNAETKHYFLDLLQFRQLSNTIALNFNVTHESPQLLLIKNGVCIYHASHYSISYIEITTQMLAHSHA